MKNKLHCPPANAAAGGYSSTNASIGSSRTSTSAYSGAAAGTAAENSNSSSAFLWGMLAGAAAGVVAGILLAPDRGRETRRNIGTTAATLGRTVTDSIQTSKSKVEDMLKEMMGGCCDSDTFNTNSNSLAGNEVIASGSAEV